VRCGDERRDSGPLTGGTRDGDCNCCGDAGCDAPKFSPRGARGRRLGPRVRRAPGDDPRDGPRDAAEMGEGAGEDWRDERRRKFMGDELFGVRLDGQMARGGKICRIR
jgi:hypothetical protein